MSDAKEQELIEAIHEADSECIAAGRNLLKVDHKYGEACRKLYEYRASKAQQGGKDAR